MDEAKSNEERIKYMKLLSKDIDKRFDALENKMENHFRCIIGAIIMMIGGLIVTKFI